MLHTNIKTLLKERLIERTKRNARYSIRAMSRDLEVTPAFLSKLLSGKTGVSPDMARKIGKKLGLSKNELDLLTTYTESKFARSQKTKKQAIKKLKQLGHQFEDLSLDNFKLINNWYAIALHTLISLHPDTKDIKFFADRLGIKPILVAETIKSLIELKMLEETRTGYQRSGAYFVNSAGVSSKDIRAYHSQMCDQAKESLEFQTADERDFSNFVIPMDETDLSEAKKIFKEFREDFNERFGSGAGPKTEIYSLNIQFFRLSKKTEGVSNEKK